MSEINIKRALVQVSNKVCRFSFTYFRRIFLVFVILLMTITCQSKKEDESVSKVNVGGILKVSADGVFMRDDKPYYGIGINYFNAFYRTIVNSNDKTYKEGFKYLNENKIPFIRFTANGFWPSELKLYQTNKTRYFTLLDEFVEAAKANGIGLIPSLFWF